MEKEQKSGFGIVGIVIIIAAVAVLGGFFGYQYLKLQKIQEEATMPVAEPSAPPPAQTQPQPAEIDTSNWKTYRNEQYGFEVKYPSNLEFSDGQPASVPTIDFNNPSAGRAVVFSVAIFSDIKSLYGREWGDRGEVTVGGVAAQKLFRPAFSGDTVTDSTAYLVSSKSVAITFNNTDFHRISMADLDKILSTFKFIR